jgi:hypothetical protein
VRRSANTGLRQQTSRSPGKSGEVISTRSCSSNRGQLQCVGLDEGLDLRGAQRGDPIQPGGAQLIANAGAGEHAAIPDQADPGEPEAFLEFGDLGGQGFRVGGVAVEHLDRYRYPGGATQQYVGHI